MNVSRRNEAILGCLLGTAVGDALGLPAERLSRKRAMRKGYGRRHRFLFGKGMLSDDTEHTLMLTAALIEHSTSASAFRRALAWKLRWWLLALPAGVGLSTAKAITRLWLVLPVNRAGVRSAGNGAAMRGAIVGLVLDEHTKKRREFALTACRVTHTDPRAEESALLVAEAARLAMQRTPAEKCIATLDPLITSDEMKMRFAALKTALGKGLSVSDYAAEIGCAKGVSGFAPNTVAVALFAWLRHRKDFATAVRSVIQCGGDTDTVAAISGAICGSEVGEKGIPAEWIERIWDWPRSTAHIRRLARALADEKPLAPRYFWPAVPLRNIIFLVAVIAHGFRRLLP